MSLFVCGNDDCLTIDNTALAPKFWSSEGPPRCTVCVTGHWHGKFEQQRYDPERDGAVSPTGLLLER